ncbi:MAG: hypothetical protein FWD68_10205 [Alphaproteobacteria bacterium]|nr:hypothetical protein [Alphaproteobacteria bacterium]
MHIPKDGSVSGGLQAAISEFGIPAVISLCRDERRILLPATSGKLLRSSPNFVPTRPRALEMPLGAFNQRSISGSEPVTDVYVDSAIIALDLTGRTLLNEWDLAMKVAESKH